MPVPQERRLTTRKTLERLTYIDLPAHNGGIVTDVSEGGLGFHAVAPVESAGPIRFSFTGGSSQPIAGMGELMWTDEKGKIGGLRFTDLAEEIREQIRNWPLESNLRFKAVKAAVPEAPAATESLAAAATPRVTSPTQGALPESAAQASTNSVFSSYAPYFPETLSPETRFGKRSSRLLKTIGVCSLAGVIGVVVSYLCYREARQWLAASQERGQGIRTSPGLAAVPAPNASSESSAIVPVSNSSAEGSEAASAAPGASEAHDATPPGPQAAAESQTPAADGEILFVQVAAYTNEADAFNLVYSLRGQHFIAFISPPVTDAYYRVQLGPYTSLEAAQIGKRELEKAGFKPFIRH